MTNYETVAGASADELVAGEHVAAIVHNVSLAANASVSRGELICAAEGVWSPVTTEADASKPLAIVNAANDGASVTSAYVAGVFNQDKVIVGGAASLTAETFREALRKDNIHLTKGR